MPVVALLLERGGKLDPRAKFDPNMRYGGDRFTDRTTPLMYAAMAGHEAAVELLLARGADVNLQGNKQRDWYAGGAGCYTALMFASYFRHAACVALLIKAGARSSAHRALQRAVVLPLFLAVLASAATCVVARRSRGS